MSSTLDDRSATRPARSASVTIPLDVPVAAVWQALTDPHELMQWFPTDAAHISA